MIEMLSGFPGNVVAFAGTERITKRDYETVVAPAVGQTVSRHGKARLYYQVGPDFTGFDVGAMWEDFKVGIETWTRWERVAVVTDVHWIGQAVAAFTFLIPGEVRVFPLQEAAQARAWIAEASAP